MRYLAQRRPRGWQLMVAGQGSLDPDVLGVWPTHYLGVADRIDQEITQKHWRDSATVTDRREETPCSARGPSARPEELESPTF